MNEMTGKLRKNTRSMDRACFRHALHCFSGSDVRTERRLTATSLVIRGRKKKRRKKENIHIHIFILSKEKEVFVSSCRPACAVVQRS
jgi:hypothetical protein